MSSTPLDLTDKQMDASSPLLNRFRLTCARPSWRRSRTRCETCRLVTAPVHHIVRELQRQFFDPPDLSRSASLPRWARKGGGIRPSVEG